MGAAKNEALSAARIIYTVEKLLSQLASQRENLSFERDKALRGFEQHKDFISDYQKGESPYGYVQVSLNRALMELETKLRSCDNHFQRLSQTEKGWQAAKEFCKSLRANRLGYRKAVKKVLDDLHEELVAFNEQQSIIVERIKALENATVCIESEIENEDH